MLKERGMGRLGLRRREVQERGGRMEKDKKKEYLETER